MKLAVVLLHWEDVAATALCIASVEAAARIASDDCVTHLLLVDNGSATPLTLDELASCTSSRIELIRNDHNLGFSGGMNVGVLAAKSAGADAIWLLNNDTQLEPNAINAMVNYLGKNPEIACVGSVILDNDGSQISTIGGYTYQPWLSRAKPIGYRVAPKYAAKAARNFDYVCGSAIMLAPAYFQKLTTIPNQSFLYFEELYLSRALSEHGLTAQVCSEVLIRHTRGVGTSKLENSQRSYLVTISALQYTWQYHPFLIPTVLIARVARAIYLSVEARQLGTLIGCFKAVFHFLSRCHEHTPKRAAA